MNHNNTGEYRTLYRNNVHGNPPGTSRTAQTMRTPDGRTYLQINEAWPPMNNTHPEGPSPPPSEEYPDADDYDEFGRLRRIDPDQFATDRPSPANSQVYNSDDLYSPPQQTSPSLPPSHSDIDLEHLQYVEQAAEAAEASNFRAQEEWIAESIAEMDRNMAAKQASREQAREAARKNYATQLMLIRPARAEYNRARISAALSVELRQTQETIFKEYQTYRQEVDPDETLQGFGID
jgi:hypothetical protein